MYIYTKNLSFYSQLERAVFELFNFSRPESDESLEEGLFNKFKFFSLKPKKRKKKKNQLKTQRTPPKVGAHRVLSDGLQVEFLELQSFNVLGFLKLDQPPIQYKNYKKQNRNFDDTMGFYTNTDAAKAESIDDKKNPNQLTNKTSVRRKKKNIKALKTIKRSHQNSYYNKFWLTNLHILITTSRLTITKYENKAFFSANTFKIAYLNEIFGKKYLKFEKKIYFGFFFEKNLWCYLLRPFTYEKIYKFKNFYLGLLLLNHIWELVFPSYKQPQLPALNPGRANNLSLVKKPTNMLALNLINNTTTTNLFLTLFETTECFFFLNNFYKISNLVLNQKTQYNCFFLHQDCYIGCSAFLYPHISPKNTLTIKNNQKQLKKSCFYTLKITYDEGTPTKYSNLLSLNGFFDYHYYCFKTRLFEFYEKKTASLLDENYYIYTNSIKSFKKHYSDGIIRSRDNSTLLPIYKPIYNKKHEDCFIKVNKIYRFYNKKFIKKQNLKKNSLFNSVYIRQLNPTAHAFLKPTI